VQEVVKATNCTVVGLRALVVLLVAKGVITLDEYAHAVQETAVEMGVEIDDGTQRSAQQEEEEDG